MQCGSTGSSCTRSGYRTCREPLCFGVISRSSSETSVSHHLERTNHTSLYSDTRWMIRTVSCNPLAQLVFSNGETWKKEMNNSRRAVGLGSTTAALLVQRQILSAELFDFTELGFKRSRKKKTTPHWIAHSSSDKIFLCDWKSEAGKLKKKSLLAFTGHICGGEQSLISSLDVLSHHPSNPLVKQGRSVWASLTSGGGTSRIHPALFFLFFFFLKFSLMTSKEAAPDWRRRAPEVDVRRAKATQQWSKAVFCRG